MKIVIIGTGNVATVLAKKFLAAGHTIQQVYGRNISTATVLANQLLAPACSNWQQITTQAELYIIALSDKAIPEAAINLLLRHKLVVHTAGAVPMGLLKNTSTNYGVFYPCQTIKKQVEPTLPIPIFVNASNETAKNKLIALAQSISSQVSEANDAQRLQYHLCAVMVNNFTNYLYAAAESYCMANKLDFKNLIPLIQETANRISYYSPASLQTGPALRNDIETIHQHLQLLNDTPQLKKMYTLITESIKNFNWQNLG